MGWLSGWQYRKSHEIDGSTAGAVTDYQVRIRVHYGSGTDSGEDVYLNEKCRSDFGDVRFTDSGGEALLAYWMEEKVDGDYAVFWVKVPSIPADPDKATIYIYYGKSDATYEGDGGQVFEFFDDFEDGVLDTGKWTVLRGTWDEEVGYLKTASGDTVHIIRSTYSGGDYAIETRIKAVSGEHRTGGAASRIQDKDNYYRPYLKEAADEIEIRKIQGGSDYTLVKTSKTLETNVWYRLTAAVYGTTLKLTVDGTTISATDSAFSSGYAGLYGNGTMNYDWFAVRKYVEPEPSHGSWGSEEEYAPIVSTQPPSNVTAISATLNGSVDAINDTEIVERGFEWGTEPGSYPNSWTETGSFGTGSFSHDLGGLQPNTTYYYRAKAKNDKGKWGYGDEVSFTTKSGIPSVSTLDPDVNGQDVTMKGEVTDLNGSPDVSERGFEWGMESGNYPHSWTESGSFPAEQFSHQETLTSWITYYYRAKAKGVGGWGYGEERSFITYEPGYGMIYFPSSKDLALDLSWAKWMRLYLYGDHAEDFAIKIRLHQDAENYFEASLTVKAGEWRKYEISMATLSQVGSPNLSNINYIAIVSPHILLIDSDFVFLSAIRELMRVKFTLRRDSPDDPSPKIKLVKVIWREGA